MPFLSDDLLFKACLVLPFVTCTLGLPRLCQKRSRRISSRLALCLYLLLFSLVMRPYNDFVPLHPWVSTVFAHVESDILLTNHVHLWCTVVNYWMVIDLWWTVIITHPFQSLCLELSRQLTAISRLPQCLPFISAWSCHDNWRQFVNCHSVSHSFPLGAVTTIDGD